MQRTESAGHCCGGVVPVVECLTTNIAAPVQVSGDRTMSRAADFVSCYAVPRGFAFEQVAGRTVRAVDPATYHNRGLCITTQSGRSLRKDELQSDRKLMFPVFSSSPGSRAFRRLVLNGRRPCRLGTDLPCLSE